MTEEQRLSRHGIGASEIAAIAGMNPFASPWDVWLRKTGQAPDIDETEPMEWGIRLEPAIRQKYADDTGSIVIVPGESLFHPEILWARATPDGIVSQDPLPEHPAAWRYLVQCKNVGYWVEKAWSHAPPQYVQLQEQWEMLVTGLTRADVAVLIGGNEFRIYTVHRDPKLIDDLVTIASEFWRRVETRTEPVVDDSEACRRHFESQYPRAEAVEMLADTAIEQDLSEWRSLHEQMRSAKRRVETIRNTMRRYMAEAQADRIVSSQGTAFLSRPSVPTPTPDTNWRLVAELIATQANLDANTYAEIVNANTETVTLKAKERTLYAPKEWSKSE